MKCLQNHRKNGKIREEIRDRVCIRGSHFIDRGNSSVFWVPLEKTHYQSVNMKVFHRQECMSSMRVHAACQGGDPTKTKQKNQQTRKSGVIGNTEITMLLFRMDTGLGDGSVIKECPNKTQNPHEKFSGHSHLLIAPVNGRQTRTPQKRPEVAIQN